MMAYPVLNRFENSRMIYLQKSAVVVRDLHNGAVKKIPVSDLPAVTRETYGIAPQIADTALRLMKRN
jgi:hypothetical protein